jgi:hypothetical protein
LTLPPYDEYTRTYILADGSRITHLAYWTWRRNLDLKREEQAFKAKMEYELKCVEATQFMGDMLSGYAPSIAISRANKRRHGGSLNDKAAEYKRKLLREALEQCTEAQRAFFNRMYVSIDEIPDEKMDWAYEQCLRTIEQNKAKKNEISPHS